MKTVYFLAFVLLVSSLSPACNASRQTKGAIIGAGTGAAAGAVLGKKNKAAAIIFGAALGGIAGGLIGQYMDKQAEKISKDLEGAKVERVGEGILITFDSGILFDVDSYALKGETRSHLDQLSGTLKKYADTDLMILGHTDNTGTEEHNSLLSRKRASAVNAYLESLSIEPGRLTTKGYGESDPIATNETVVGRQLNRRVEIVIVANDKLKRAAKRGDLVIQ